MISSEKEKRPSRIQDYFGFIQATEVKKVVLMALIVFCLLFNATIVHNTEDVLVVNAASAYIIPFLKLYCVSPATILFVILYAKLCNICSKENIFYIVVVTFLLFFITFGYVIYPNREFLHPSQEAINLLRNEYPNFRGFIDIYSIWTFSLFYVMAELWTSVTVSLLFWQFVNQVTTVDEAKRFYNVFVAIGNLGLVFGGQTEYICNNLEHYFGITGHDWGLSLQILMTIVITVGSVALILYRYVNSKILINSNHYIQAFKSKKPKISLLESAKIIFSSKDIGLIIMLVVSYGIAISLVEIQWKQQLYEYYQGNKNNYHAFMGNAFTIIGSLSVLCVIVTGFKINWLRAALVTPITTFVCGVLFLGFILTKESLMGIFGFLTEYHLKIGVYLGSFAMILSKAVKYAFFDPTKEMTYITLNDELKTKGKAVVDIIGVRMGKAGGSFIQSTLSVIFSTTLVTSTLPITFAIFIVICIGWLLSVKALGKNFDM